MTNKRVSIDIGGTAIAPIHENITCPEIKDSACFCIKIITTTWENVSVYVLNASDCKITAYGFIKP